VMGIVAEASSRWRVLVVPGGGALADTVREVDRALRLSPNASHWMAVKAMDQSAEVLIDRYPATVLVSDAHAARHALRQARVPVLAPYRWLRDTDALPHSWEVTSDSIAAWVAGQLGAGRVVLVKSPGASGDLVDVHYRQMLPATAESRVVTADDVDALRAACRP
jgi:5-(aminomethyl)-3-furanmethanol phosphate kinase